MNDENQIRESLLKNIAELRAKLDEIEKYAKADFPNFEEGYTQAKVVYDFGQTAGDLRANHWDFCRYGFAKEKGQEREFQTWKQKAGFVS